ncbi:lysophospholipid acyltransferase family protein [Sphaerisporangium sp. B11E5]|uniref:lysophospholipid acyltransferase family protein n=1 Tax=Sphaerisporangium sp. B11E5 TaxID=3153563 RepID=UPI00325F4C60
MSDPRPAINRLLQRVFPGPLIRLMFRPVVDGRANLPSSGPGTGEGLIIACNHLSFLDPVLVQLTVRHPIVFLAKSDYFTGSSRLFLGALLSAAGMIPVDRHGGDDGEKALDAAAAVLGRGGFVGIFPEGTRSRDGLLHRGRTGVGRLHLRTGAAVVPIALLNTDAILPAGRIVPRLRRARMRCGEPMFFEDLPATSDTARASRLVTDAVMGRLQELCDRPYDDTYATRFTGTG